ncbi:endonuclease/exonuclease/phosphatase family protein [Pseudonocardia oroxyli]|uniref:Endonuclease/exonuclease/phosphatase domain-containing protein n=1 Tax=Pseudonocardia oroxyli TaxID=366584 RepID=A0A1G7K4L1_PSEOR|nr:endonuclease/exonuclease/phosphatase family protein [Pseudonocardia oroxyli]SDF31974.1 hypothetical protein SAMN05216377_104238 [Pseudonocardia oroxyli]
MLQRPRSRTGLIGPAAAVVVPWLWFPLRDLLGPVGDVLAILWPVVVVLVVAVLARRRRWAYLPGIVSLLVVGVLVVLAPWRPQPTGPVDPTGAVRVAAANITVLTDAARDTWQGPTQVTSWRLLLLRIDHVLVSPGWCGDDPLHVPLPGSDHQAVTATVGPCR